MPTYEELKDRHRAERQNHSEYLTVRIHRALSWLKRADSCEDLDGRFIFLWISFNAAYANEILKSSRPHEQEMFNSFLTRLCELDADGLLNNLVWKEFSSNTRLLVNNQYIFQPYWDHSNGKISEQQWLEHFDSAKKSASLAIGRGDTPTVLAIIFARLYTLRNQLLHGGATWNSKVNRDQIRNCSMFLGSVVPIIIGIMMDSPNELWGQPCYPVLQS